MSQDSILLISLQPRFAEMIYSGTKQIELRKREPGRRPGLVYIHEKGLGITGSFSSGGIVVGPSIWVWAMYGDRTGLGYAEYQSWFGQADKVVAMSIYRACHFHEPMPIPAMRARGIHPPQGYRWLPTSPWAMPIIEGASAG